MQPGRNVPTFRRISCLRDDIIDKRERKKERKIDKHLKGYLVYKARSGGMFLILEIKEVLLGYPFKD
jgi:hypothetical protein